MSASLLRLILVLVLLLPCAAWAMEVQTIPALDGGVDRMTVETPAYVVKIVFSRGARIESLINKTTGKNGVSWGAAGGGLLDDRQAFTEANYLTSQFKHDDKQVTITASAQTDNGLEIQKRFIFTQDQPGFQVDYTIRNLGYKPVRFWIRNLGVPEGDDLSPRIRTRFQEAAAIKSFDGYPSGYHSDIRGGWLTLRQNDDGPGWYFQMNPAHLQQFYFWTGSKRSPTFEWVYQPLEPGQQMQTTLHIGILRQGQKAGFITSQGTPEPGEKVMPAPVIEPFAKIPGWRPLSDLYAPTPQETRQGFIVTQLSTTPPHARLKEVTIHVGRHEAELVPVELFVLRPLKHIYLTIEDENGAPIPAIQAQAENDYQLQPGQVVEKAEPASHVRLWLYALPQDKESQFKGKVTIHADDQQATLPLSMKVWPVDLPRQLMTPLKGYSQALTMGSWNYITGKDPQMYPAMLEAQRGLNNRTYEIHLNFQAKSMLRGVKEKATGKPLFDWLREHGPVTLETLPDLDFSTYDPAVKLAQSYGLDQVHMLASLDLDTAASSVAIRPFAKLALGIEKLDDTQAGKLMQWLAMQNANYYRSLGAGDIWVKVGDEIAPDEIDTWLNTAAVYRAIGLKTYTTNSIGIPRDAALLNKLLPQTDGFEVSLVFTRDFLLRTRGGSTATRVRQSIPADIRWFAYTNGGAVNTWFNQAVLPAKVNPEEMEEVTLTANGQPLTHKAGTSPWGNKQANVSYQSGKTFYVALPAGQNPNGVKMEMTYRRRVPAATGTRPAAVDIGDRPVCYYFGGGYFKAGYLYNRGNTWVGTVNNLAGMGYYTTWHWLPERRLWWYQPGKSVIYSPAYHGLRDGQEDSAWYRAVVQAGADTQVLASIAGQGADTALPIIPIRHEQYLWDGIDPAVGSANYTLAKQRMLQWLTQHQAPLAPAR